MNSAFINSTIERARDIVVDNNSKTVLALSQILRNLPSNEQRQHFGGEYHSGFTYLFRSDKYPGVVMETVTSPMGDAITSLYRDHRELATIGTLMNLRKALILSLVEQVGLSAEAIGIDDEARGRSLAPRELSTGQLIDLLSESVGKSVVVSASHGGDLDIAKQEMPL